MLNNPLRLSYQKGAAGYLMCSNMLVILKPEQKINAYPEINRHIGKHRERRFPLCFFVVQISYAVQT